MSLIVWIFCANLLHPLDCAINCTFPETKFYILVLITNIPSLLKKLFMTPLYSFVVIIFGLHSIHALRSFFNLIVCIAAHIIICQTSRTTTQSKPHANIIHNHLNIHVARTCGNTYKNSCKSNLPPEQDDHNSAIVKFKFEHLGSKLLVQFKYSKFASNNHVWLT